MRKLKLQMQTTVNGFVGGPNGELDFMMWDWDKKIEKYVDDLTDTIDCILLGRKMTDGFVSYWTEAVKNPKGKEYLFAQKMVDTPKVVFTKTLNESQWANTTLAKGELSDEVNKLKNQKGKDMIVYGGANFVSNLIQAGLIDEYYIFINPSAIPAGLTIFGNINSKNELKLVKSIPFECGIVLMQYEPKK